MDKKTKIIGIVVLVTIAGFLLVMFTNKKGGSTVDMNETLDIKVSNLDYDFSVKVNSIETNQEIEDEEYAKLNLTMTRNGGDVPNSLNVIYALLDSQGNELDSVISYTYSFPFSDIDSNTYFREENLESNKTTSGDLYFKTSSNDIKKLKIGIATKGWVSTDADMAYYYINLD